MEIDKVFENRKSVRSFKSKKASWKSIMEAIDASIKAPFAGNLNNLRFLIIEEQKTIDKIADISEQLWINESGIIVIVCSDDRNLENMYGERGRIYSRQQAGAAIENFLLKITDLGLSACWVGAYKDELIKQLLTIPEHIQIEAIIPVGYEKGKTAKKKKKDLDKAIYWEKWGEGNRPSLFEEDLDPNSVSMT